MGRMLLTAIGVAVVSLATAGAAGPTTSLTGPGIIRITSSVKKFARIDVGQRGYSAGDMEMTRVRLYNKRIRPRPIGNGQLACTATGEKFWNCNGTYVLPAGKITVSGMLIYRDFYDMAVTGGTERYRNVRGTLVVTRLRPTEKLMVFRLVIS
jgi:hypothetical protein